LRHRPPRIALTAALADFAEPGALAPELAPTRFAESAIDAALD